MKMEDVFFIHASKLLIFRKEEEDYITFSPEKLEYYKVNFIGAEILYLISKKVKYKDIINHFAEKYKISKEKFEKDLKNFLLSFGCIDLMKKNLEECNIEL